MKKQATNQDPNTGQFTKGNSGRPEGSKNVRTLQWEELGKELTSANAGRFNDLLGKLWDSEDLGDQVRAAELFLKLIEYFKPKLQRVQTISQGTTLIPPLCVVDGKAEVPPHWPGPIITFQRASQDPQLSEDQRA